MMTEPNKPCITEAEWKSMNITMITIDEIATCLNKLLQQRGFKCLTSTSGDSRICMEHKTKDSNKKMSVEVILFHGAPHVKFIYEPHTEYDKIRETLCLTATLPIKFQKSPISEFVDELMAMTPPVKYPGQPPYGNLL